MDDFIVYLADTVVDMGEDLSCTNLVALAYTEGKPLFEHLIKDGNKTTTRDSRVMLSIGHQFQKWIILIYWVGNSASVSGSDILVWVPTFWFGFRFGYSG